MEKASYRVACPQLIRKTESKDENKERKQACIKLSIFFSFKSKGLEMGKNQKLEKKKKQILEDFWYYEKVEYDYQNTI